MLKKVKYNDKKKLFSFREKKQKEILYYLDMKEIQKSLFILKHFLVLIAWVDFLYF